MKLHNNINWVNLQVLRHKSFEDDREQDFARFDLWRVNRQLDFMERRIDMAQGKTSKKPLFGNDVTFVTVRLDKDQAVAFTTWQNTKGIDFELELGDFMSRGWKTSITWDNGNDCYIVSSTCKDDRNVNHNLCITSRSTNWYEAMLLNVYKVTVMFKNGKLPTEQTENNWG